MSILPPLPPPKENLLFELPLTDVKIVSYLAKILESLLQHSDTHLFKVKKKGAYIVWTDFESLCCGELRLQFKSVASSSIQEKRPPFLTANTLEFTAKIMLDSLSTTLKFIAKRKNHAILFAREPFKLMVAEIPVGGQTVQHKLKEYEIRDTEYRMRVYHIISTREFEQKSSNLAKFQIPALELSRVINAMAIFSGTHAGIATLSIKTQGKNDVVIKMTATSQNGAKAFWTIDTFTDSKDVPVLKTPIRPIELEFLLTYLKRSQNLLVLSHQQDSKDLVFATLIVSEKGLILETIHGSFSCLTFITDVSKEDLSAYV